MFHNWSVRKVYEYLKKRKEELDKADQDGNQPQPCPQQNNSSTNDESQNETDIDEALRNMDKGMDDHVFKEIEDMTAEELKKLEDSVDKALRQGGMLAGRMGASIPRVIGDLLEPKVDWREVFREFVQSAMRGKDEYTWRKMNKSYLANDMYLPSMHSETMGELVVAIDTSGSIDNEQISEFASELASICETCSPDKVRVLWWDTKVHGEQVFEGNYGDIAKMLKPQGGGGTHVGCVSEYIIKSSINAEALVIFTDGYVENNPKWEVTTPTMWFVTQNSSFVPPAGGRCVTVEQ
jgi:predicted metal-dependent peptidase